MIIKSHIRGGYRSAAEYLKDQGLNEKTRLVEISDEKAKNLDEAFHNMWEVADNTKARKPLHHISINPMKGEWLTDSQVRAIVERCEQIYGYTPGQHQRVIVEHIKDGRQHFHVIWNRVNLITNKTVWPGEHWKKSKQICREMEKELGIKRPMPNRTKRAINKLMRTGRVIKSGNRYYLTKAPNKTLSIKPPTLGDGPIRPFRMPVTRSRPAPPARPTPLSLPFIKRRRRRKKKSENPDFNRPIRDHEWTTAELIAWAWERERWDILAQFGIYVGPGFFEP